MHVAKAISSIFYTTYNPTTTTFSVPLLPPSLSCHCCSLLSATAALSVLLPSPSPVPPLLLFTPCTLTCHLGPAPCPIVCHCHHSYVPLPPLICATATTHMCHCHHSYVPLPPLICATATTLTASHCLYVLPLLPL